MPSLNDLRKYTMSPQERAATERDEQESRERQRQANCSHYDCDVVTWNWEGKPTEVVCRECEAVNYIHYE